MTSRQMAKSEPLYDLGEADITGVTAMGRPMLRYVSRRYPGIVFEFSQGRSGHRDPRISYWRCLACKKLQISTGIALKDRSHFLVDPDRPPREHQCVSALYAKNGKVRIQAVTAEESDIVQNKRRERLEGVGTSTGDSLALTPKKRRRLAGNASGAGAMGDSGASGDISFAMANANGGIDDDAIRQLANGALEEDDEQMFAAPPMKTRSSGGGGSTGKKAASTSSGTGAAPWRNKQVNMKTQLEMDALKEELRHRRQLNEIAESRERMAMDAELQHMADCNQLAQQRMELENSILELKKSKLDLRIKKLRSGELPVEALAESGSELDDEESDQLQAAATNGDPAAQQTGARTDVQPAENHSDNGPPRRQATGVPAISYEA